MVLCDGGIDPVRVLRVPATLGHAQCGTERGRVVPTSGMLLLIWEEWYQEKLAATDLGRVVPGEVGGCDEPA
eukprot:2935276-Rhodomonas_salina.1